MSTKDFSKNKMTDDIVAEINGGNGKEISYGKIRFKVGDIVRTKRTYRYIQAGAVCKIIQEGGRSGDDKLYFVIPIGKGNLMGPVPIPKSDLILYQGNGN